MSKSLEGPMMLDALTLLDLIQPPGGREAASPMATMSVVYRGSQVSGTLKTFHIANQSWLIRVTTTVSYVSFARTPTVFPSVTSGVFTVGHIGIAGTGGNIGAWEGRERLDGGDTLYVDSLSGMGLNDITIFVFAMS